jgi:hypothetical protein
MGPRSHVRSIVDRNIVMRRIPVYGCETTCHTGAIIWTEDVREQGTQEEGSLILSEKNNQKADANCAMRSFLIITPH